MTAAALTCIAAPALAAGPEPLDKEFLDYLAACEGKDDNWTVVADDAGQKRKVAEKAPPVARPPADKPAPKAEDKP
jgi:hypothetical protein